MIALDRAANGGDSGECGKYGMGRSGGNGKRARRRFTYHIKIKNFNIFIAHAWRVAENVAAAANLATEEKAATVVTAGKVDKVANVATVVKAVTTGAMEKVAKVAHFDL